MKDQGVKHDFPGILLFSLLAGLFCAVLSVIVAAILTGFGNLKQADLRDFLIPAAATFVVAFAATLASNYYGLFWWRARDEM